MTNDGYNSRKLVVPNDKNNNDNKERIFLHARRKIWTLFNWQSLGLILSLSSLLSVQMLQTSINIQAQLGSITLAAGFAASIFVGIFICPTFLEKLKPSSTLILADLCHLIYCACNFYPELYVLLPGAIFAGIGRALFLPSYSMLILKLSSHCTKYSKTKDESHYFDQFQSRYYCVNECVQIIGNGLSYAILFGIHSPADEVNKNHTLSEATNGSLYTYCGANDCQETEIIELSMHKYVPPTKTSIHVFLLSCIVIGILGIIIHWMIFPGMLKYSHNLTKIDLTVKRRLTELNLSNVNTANALCKDSDYEIQSKSNVKICPSIANNESENLLPRLQADQKAFDYWGTIQKTLLFMIRYRSILLGIAALHCGMLIGFTFADLTRAYASCVSGVQMTGAYAMSFGIAGMISSLAYGKILPVFGRLYIFIGACGLELAVYALCYLWEPDPKSSYTIFIIFIGIGLVNGTVRQNVIATYTTHFPNSKTISLSGFNIAYTCGYGIQYALSTFMCVSSKIFTQITITVLGLVCYCVAEFSREASIRKRKNGCSEEVAT